MLLLLANFGKEGRPEPIIAKIRQETLAEMIGTTRSRVSHLMNKFRHLGFIDYNGHLEVHSSLLSVVLTDPPRSVVRPSPAGLGIQLFSFVSDFAQLGSRRRGTVAPKDRDELREVRWEDSSPATGARIMSEHHLNA